MKQLLYNEFLCTLHISFLNYGQAYFNCRLISICVHYNLLFLCNVDRHNLLYRRINYEMMPFLVVSGPSPFTFVFKALWSWCATVCLVLVRLDDRLVSALVAHCWKLQDQDGVVSIGHISLFRYHENIKKKYISVQLISPYLKLAEFVISNIIYMCSAR